MKANLYDISMPYGVYEDGVMAVPVNRAKYKPEADVTIFYSPHGGQYIMRGDQTHLLKANKARCECDCLNDCLEIYDDEDFREFRNSVCCPETCGWREQFIESDFERNDP